MLTILMFFFRNMFQHKNNVKEANYRRKQYGIQIIRMSKGYTTLHCYDLPSVFPLQWTSYRSAYTLTQAT